MDILAQLPQVEAMCERLYTAQTPQERTQAEQALRPFGQSTEYITHCKAILDNSRSPYAQLLASSSLLKLVTEHQLTPQIRIEMKKYFLQYLDTHGAGMEPFVATSLVQLLCRTVKLAWFDHDAAKAIVDDCKALMERGSPGQYLLGLKILAMLVSEMNTPTPGRTLTAHRKIAVSFRDLSLLNVFKASLVALRVLLDGKADDKLKEQGLGLALSCLSFDFVGTCLDDSAEDMSTIQVPSSWRALVEAPETLQLFLDYYAASGPPPSRLALECLVRLASVRRSLFSSDAERSKFLNRLVNGCRDILRSQSGLAEHHDNYHEFCRLLGRLKTNYQLSELVSVDNYTEWIQLVAQLTIDSLNSWQWAKDSVYYLLGLWSRLVSSMPYLKGDSPSLLEANVPKITQAYITSRLESVALAVGTAGCLDEMLDAEEALSEQLESLPYLVRFQYDKSSAFVASLMDPLLEHYKAAAGLPSLDGPARGQLAVLEGQLAWLVSIVGSVIRGRLSSSSSSAESQEAIDGDLAARVFGLLPLMDSGLHAQRYADNSRQRLDMAVLGFFQSFRKVYIGEQVMQSSNVYSRLGERLGLADHAAVLGVMLAKVATNLKVYGASEQLVHLTLGLFQDLATGYMSGKLLLKLEAVHFMLGHHTSAYYAFLEHPTNGRNRTCYYNTLARLLFMEDVPQRFKGFMAPLASAFSEVAARSSGCSSPSALRASTPQAAVVGLFRDLRGVAAATSTRRTYGLLFDWMYPDHCRAVLCCLEAFADVPAVTTPLLKFVSEFAFNKSQRLTFDSSSPNGILLFREVSKVLVAYGNHALSLGAVGDAYNDKYKGIWVCLQALARAMSGSYVNFGVFELYGDAALKDALSVALRLVLSMPLADIMSYKKVAKAYFALLEVLAHNHTGALASVDGPTFAFILTSLDQGLKSLDVSISSACASAVDNLASFYFRNVVREPESGRPAPGSAEMQEHLSRHPGLLPEILRSLFDVILFEEHSNQWSLSRPMLSLILINEQHYGQLRQQIVLAQPPDKQAHLSSCLDKLMADVGTNLEPKNRDKFTQNLTIVRHTYRSKS
ncbi:XPO7 [Scenedesmus sp. PABB004]|nr:XPO7 [Scenedesmus sp. PABB004]